MITRAKDQSASLASALIARGARVVEVAVFAVEPPVDGGADLRAAVADDLSFDWVVLTSPNGVDAFVRARDAAAAGAVSIAVVGSGTAARLETYGLFAALVPDRFLAEGLVDAFPDAPECGGRVLVAQADGARDVVATGLRAKGWDVATVVAYRNVAAVVSDEAMARARDADAIAFTSSSTVERYMAAAGEGTVAPVVACIGPITAATAESLGLVVSVVAEPHTIDGLVVALDEFFARSPLPGA